MLSYYVSGHFKPGLLGFLATWDWAARWSFHLRRELANKFIICQCHCLWVGVRTTHSAAHKLDVLRTWAFTLTSRQWVSRPTFHKTRQHAGCWSVRSGSVALHSAQRQTKRQVVAVPRFRSRTRSFNPFVIRDDVMFELMQYIIKKKKT